MKKILAFHGFLGRPNDWSPFKRISLPVEIQQTDLSMAEWAREFNKTLDQSEPYFLVGYSLGGRLAMHLLLDSPSLWLGAILISAHPGLSNEQERQERLLSDQKWAIQFLNSPWDELMEKWNRLPVFGNRLPHFERREIDFNRQTLCSQLVTWSLGTQRDLLPELKQLNIPLLYLAGEEDKKFCQVAAEFASFAKVKIFKNAAHRVPWEAPEEFEHTLNEFITTHQHA